MSVMVNNSFRTFAQMKKDNHNTVDVKVGKFIRSWVVSTYGTDIISLRAAAIPFRLQDMMAR